MSGTRPPGGGRDWRREPKSVRDDRNLAELLQELRVAGLGVQVLSGFLLSLPFTSRFERLGGGQRDLYVAAVTLAAVALAISVAVLLVLSYVIPDLAAAVISAFVVLLFAGLWLALPVARRGHPQARHDVAGNERRARLPPLTTDSGGLSGPRAWLAGAGRKRRRMQHNDWVAHHRTGPRNGPGTVLTAARLRGEPQGRLGRWSGRAEGTMAVTA